MKEVFYGGDILTMEDDVQVEAVLVTDGYVEAVGTKKEIFALADSKTKFTDLRGKCLMPAFIDPHSHIVAYTKVLGRARLDECCSFDDICDEIKRIMRSKPVTKDTWVVGTNYDEKLLIEKTHPPKYVIDSVCPCNPCVIVHKNRKTGIINSFAIRNLGFDLLNPQLPNADGIYLQRDPNTGEFTGWIDGEVFEKLSPRWRALTDDEIERQLRMSQNSYIQNGFTIVQEGLCFKKDLIILQDLERKGLLKLDIYCYIDMVRDADYPLTVRERDYEHLHLSGYKLILDGGPQQRTAWVSKPYKTDPGNCGTHTYSDEQLIKLFTQAKENHLQMIAHANGDLACEQFVNTVEKVYGPSNKNYRPVLIHAQLVTNDQLVRCARMGIVVSFYNTNAYNWGDIHIRNLGELAYRCSPAKSALDLGVTFNFHQDTPAFPCDMITSIYYAVNRLTKSGQPMGLDERIPILEALKACTIYAAKTYFIEDKVGSIAVGKRADFIVLNTNPLTMPPENLNKLKVITTIREGDVLFTKDAGSQSNCCNLI
ncbi:Amidohydrolase family protein [Trichomonas vaginalis G3]|uniref:Amidohydrolase family protein n=1 Tax=Trichomonas vaginalis (strain ATCC PRA-98 / G3) TaxID=412133 RepID=A2DEC0_TRIV3|nr:imidazolonepropionase family [Trichomonas vaginalis G3]EAY21338.1 Amidohydrolase family protein [Trichomonas vaginalis G3]KAI5548925.1 imidazolonepropionase family [Trichomonas vaginalis G3]|eukprot:XP_001582324.1 Amidohydrolase family protein [Trichomonas vaginalis G3]